MADFSGIDWARELRRYATWLALAGAFVAIVAAAIFLP